MRAFVTGATGFVGWHVTRALRESGYDVRALVRPGPADRLQGLDAEILTGDLSDAEALARAMDGTDVVFHVAADYRFAADDTQVFRTNVSGTRNVMQAAARAGVGRVVYTSSVATLEPDHDDGATEEMPAQPADLIGAYKRSKYLAERVALRWVDRGLQVVVVNPSTPIGPRDARPTPTGQFVIDFLAGRMPAYVDTGLNLVDVRDVAVGHLLAAERGVSGQRYILGNRNLTLRQILDLIAQIAGVPRARVKLPHWVPLMFACLEERLARLQRRPPRVSREAVKLSQHRMFFDSSKAVRELGLPQSPIESALALAVSWFRSHGYVPA
jgi:dihydroflavonol-4-reductase